MIIDLCKKNVWEKLSSMIWFFVCFISSYLELFYLCVFNLFERWMTLFFLNLISQPWNTRWGKNKRCYLRLLFKLIYFFFIFSVTDICIWFINNIIQGILDTCLAYFGFFHLFSFIIKSFAYFLNCNLTFQFLHI